MIATLQEKVRRALPRNSEGKLNAATGELKRLIESQRAIEKLGADKIALLASYQERMNDCAAQYRVSLDSGSVEETRIAFEAWVTAKSLWEIASEECGNMARARAAGLPLRVFLSKNGNAKQILHQVCQLSLSAARADAERITKEEGDRLGSEYSPDDVAVSPVVKKATNRVSHLEHIEKRIAGEPIEGTWPIFAQQLLE